MTLNFSALFQTTNDVVKSFLGEHSNLVIPKGQIEPIADWRAIDSPKNQIGLFGFWENLLTVLSDLYNFTRCQSENMASHLKFMECYYLALRIQQQILEL